MATAKHCQTENVRVVFCRYLSRHVLEVKGLGVKWLKWPYVKSNVNEANWPQWECCLITETLQVLEDCPALRLSACVVLCLHVPGLKLHVGTYMYMYRNKSVVKTNGGVILFSVEKWIVNHWKDGPLDTGIHVCK